MLRFLPRIIMFKSHSIVILIFIRWASAAPTDGFLLVSDIVDADSEGYDIIIDERQNGTQNFRFKVSGVNVVVPEEIFRDQNTDHSSSAEPSVSSILNSAVSSQFNDPSSGSFYDIASFFDWKKIGKSDIRKKSSETQSRTKDIPTESQIVGDEATKLMDVKRRFKVLPGEKYLIPILQYIKKHAEEDD